MSDHEETPKKKAEREFDELRVTLNKDLADLKPLVAYQYSGTEARTRRSPSIVIETGARVERPTTRRIASTNVSARELGLLFGVTSRHRSSPRKRRSRTCCANSERTQTADDETLFKNAMLINGRASDARATSRARSKPPKTSTIRNGATAGGKPTSRMAVLKGCRAAESAAHTLVPGWYLKESSKTGCRELFNDSWWAGRDSNPGPTD